MTINERFELIINTLYKGNKSAFAGAIGVTPSVVDNVVGKRQGKPSYDVLEKVSALAEVNIDWLITGRGEMLNDTSLLSREQSTTISATATHDSTAKVELNTNNATIHRLTAEIAELKEQIKWYQNLIETLTKK